MKKRSKTSHSGSARNPGWFVKGRSGNRNGRPKTSRAPNGSAFEVLMEKTLTVADRGGTRKITLEEALQRRTYQDALAGKRTAVREVVKWIIQREASLAKQAPRAKQLWTVLQEHNPSNGCRTCAARHRSAGSRARKNWRRPGRASPGAMGGTGGPPPQARRPTSD